MTMVGVLIYGLLLHTSDGLNEIVAAIFGSLFVVVLVLFIAIGMLTGAIEEIDKG